MNLASIDLNLLAALDAFLLEANVSRAAVRLGLSQPAASHALRRLREAFGDPLLVRTGARMQLTPRAESLRQPLRETLDSVRDLFAGNAFVAERSERRFRLMFPDLVVELLLAPLVAQAARVAPGVSFEVVPWRGPDVLLPEFARSLDLIASFMGDAFKDFHRQRLYTDSDALAVRRGHPQAKRLGRREGFLDARHVAIVARGQREDVLEPWLREKKLPRRIAAIVPSYIEALHVAARTDLVAFVPRRLIAALAGPLALATIEPPADPGIDEQFPFHPARAQFDPGSIWLRKLVLDAARELDGGTAARRRRR